jgi:hypothetical protein
MKWETEITVPELGVPGPKYGLDEIEVEDSGRALIFHVEEEESQDNGFFVQLRSWSGFKEPLRIASNDTEGLRKQHPEFAQFAGKRVRVTVETID